MASRLRNGVAVCGAALVIAPALGCARNLVVFSTSTSLAVAVGVTEAGQQGIQVGYKRFEGVTQPVRDEQDALAREAYPVFAAFRSDTRALLISALGTSEIEQRFATGNAAKNATSDSRAFSALVGGSFVSSQSSACLDRWTDGRPDRVAELGDWMERNGFERQPNSFIFSDAFTDRDRERAIAEIPVPCDGS